METMFQYDAVAIEDINIYRHWHPGSQKYGGGDSLATCLYLGWKVGDIVYWEEHWRAGRCSIVYYFTLERDDDMMLMPVISNPYVSRFVGELAVQVLPVTQARRVPAPVRKNQRAGA